MLLALPLREHDDERLRLLVLVIVLMINLGLCRGVAVAVVVDWLHRNKHRMLMAWEFDHLVYLLLLLLLWYFVTTSLRGSIITLPWKTLNIHGLWLRIVDVDSLVGALLGIALLNISTDEWALDKLLRILGNVMLLLGLNDERGHSWTCLYNLWLDVITPILAIGGLRTLDKLLLPVAIDHQNLIIITDKLVNLFELLGIVNLVSGANHIDLLIRSLLGHLHWATLNNDTIICIAFWF